MRKIITDVTVKERFYGRLLSALNAVLEHSVVSER
jgi:hypothetical protein